MDKLVSMLRAAGDPTRLRLLLLLREAELTVSELVEIVGQSQPRVSRHLKLLGEAGLVERFKEGSWVFCRAADRGHQTARRPHARVENLLFLRGGPSLRRDRFAGEIHDRPCAVDDGRPRSTLAVRRPCDCLDASLGRTTREHDDVVTIGGERQGQNWLPTTPGSRKLFLRQYFDSWEVEPAEYRIERVGMVTARPMPTPFSSWPMRRNCRQTPQGSPRAIPNASSKG